MSSAGIILNVEDHPVRIDGLHYNLVFHYDYAGRCYRRDNLGIETAPDFPDGNFQEPYEYIIYDGVKQIMTLDGGREYATGKYVWQPESSGDADVILWDESGVYSTDCNKNVTGCHTIPEWPGQPSSTYFDYTPFGEPLNGTCRFMFSSEERFTGAGYVQANLILYLYRAYSPALKRWLTRDPIEEQGGVNLCNFVGNNPVSRWDELGTDWLDCMVACIDDNDPINYAIAKAVLSLTGMSLPKTFIAELARSVGDQKFADEIICRSHDIILQNSKVLLY